MQRDTFSLKLIFPLIGQMISLSWKAHPPLLISLVLIQALQGLSPVVSAWVTKQIFDELAEIFQNTSNPQTFIPVFLPLLLVLTLVSAFNQIAVHVSTYLNGEMGRKLLLVTQKLMYQRINSLQGLSYFENPAFHDTIRLASHGSYNGPLQILQVFITIFRGAITLISFVGLLLFVSPFLALIVLFASGPHLVAQLRISKQRYDLMYTNSPKERKASYLGQVASSLHFAKELRLFNLGDYFTNRYLETMNEVQVAQKKQQLRETRLQISLSLFSSLVSSVALGVVVFQAVQGYITIGDITLYTNAFGSVQNALFSIISSIGKLSENVLFFTKFNEFMRLPPALYVTDNPKPVIALRNGIEFRNVSFRYSENHPWVLRNLNMFIPKEECVALVGLNGSGKTTLVKLLTRLYDPTDGQILWDNVDIRDFEVKEYRSKIGAIFQDFSRYDLTAQENIGLGNVAEISNRDLVIETAKQVKVHDFIDNLPDRYQTILSRWLVEDGDGVDLSGGQWQKIATARMLIKSSDLLILDEPTASLDAAAEYEIYRRFASLVENKTSLIISHRFSTLRIADSIAVLQDGKIVEYGTHESLMKQDGEYKKLYSMQAENYK